MKKSRSSISKARSYKEIGEYWDTHDLSDIWGKTRKVKLEVVAEPEATYYPIEKDLSEKIQSVARKQGVASDVLVNLWLEQKGTENCARGSESIRNERIVRKITTVRAIVALLTRWKNSNMRLESASMDDLAAAVDVETT
jgi:hypothetical protein